MSPLFTLPPAFLLFGSQPPVEPQAVISNRVGWQRNAVHNEARHGETSVPSDTSGVPVSNKACAVDALVFVKLDKFVRFKGTAYLQSFTMKALTRRHKGVKLPKRFGLPKGRSNVHRHTFNPASSLTQVFEFVEPFESWSTLCKNIKIAKADIHELHQWAISGDLRIQRSNSGFGRASGENQRVEHASKTECADDGRPHGPFGGLFSGIRRIPLGAKIGVAMVVALFAWLLIDAGVSSFDSSGLRVGNRAQRLLYTVVGWALSSATALAVGWTS